MMATSGGMGSLAPVAAVRGAQSRNGVQGTSCASLGSSRSGLRGSSISASPVMRSRIPVPRQVVRAMAQDLAEQIKEMAAAEKRWESQVKEGKVKSLSAKEAGYAIDLSGYTLLDVRPSYEHKKAYVKNSVWLPIFDVNKSMDPGTVLSKISNFAMGGWWSGSPLMKYNERFMPDVVATIPKSANVIVACQKGLRSLAACEQLYKAGYRNLYWLNGGFDSAQEGDLEREGPEPFKFAGLGGVSEFLGWTDVQREAVAKEGIGYRIMLFARLKWGSVLIDFMVHRIVQMAEVRYVKHSDIIDVGCASRGPAVYRWSAVDAYCPGDAKLIVYMPHPKDSASRIVDFITTRKASILTF